MPQRKLAKRRREAGLTQEEVAAAVGVSVRTLRRWETGETQPSIKKLSSAFNYIDMSLAKLNPGVRKDRQD